MTKIAVPVIDDKVSRHFGHCDMFMIFAVEGDSILSVRPLQSPAHEPGVLPQWLADNNVNVIIAGGIGKRAQDLFAQKGITVISGVPEIHSKTAVNGYLKGRLQIGENLCDH